MTRFCCGLDSLPKGNKPEMKLPKRTKYVVVALKCAREEGATCQYFHFHCYRHSSIRERLVATHDK